MAAVRLALAMLAMATLAVGVNVMCSDPELNELISTTEVPAPPLIAPARRCALALRARAPRPPRTSVPTHTARRRQTCLDGEHRLVIHVKLSPHANFAYPAVVERRLTGGPKCDESAPVVTQLCENGGNGTFVSAITDTISGVIFGWHDLFYEGRPVTGPEVCAALSATTTTASSMSIRVSHTATMWLLDTARAEAARGCSMSLNVAARKRAGGSALTCLSDSRLANSSQIPPCAPDSELMPDGNSTPGKAPADDAGRPHKAPVHSAALLRLLAGASRAAPAADDGTECVLADSLQLNTCRAALWRDRPKRVLWDPSRAARSRAA